MQQRKVFLDYFIEISEKTGYFTDKDISEEVALLIFGVSWLVCKIKVDAFLNLFLKGNDTVTTTESFLFMMLGMHPEVQVLQ